MVIIWQKQAKDDLKNYINNATILEPQKYVSDLVNFVDCLYTSQYLGKVFCTLNNIEIRQLIYNMHRIFYYIDNDKIYIIKISHTSMDLSNVVKIINDFLK